MWLSLPYAALASGTSLATTVVQATQFNLDWHAWFIDAGVLVLQFISLLTTTNWLAQLVAFLIDFTGVFSSQSLFGWYFYSNWMALCNFWFQSVLSMQTMLAGDDWRASIKQGEFTCRAKLKGFLKGPSVDDQGKVKVDPMKKKEDLCICLCCIDGECASVELCQKNYLYDAFIVAIIGIFALIIIIVVTSILANKCQLVILERDRQRRREAKKAKEADSADLISNVSGYDDISQGDQLILLSSVISEEEAKKWRQV